jgi:hypothetical protein
MLVDGVAFSSSARGKTEPTRNWAVAGVANKTSHIQTPKPAKIGEEQPRDGFAYDGFLIPVRSSIVQVVF